MKKTFDCVDLQHRGQDRIREKLRGMTVDEQAAYWKQRGEELRRRKSRLLARRKAS